MSARTDESSFIKVISKTNKLSARIYFVLNTILKIRAIFRFIIRIDTFITVFIHDRRKITC